MEKIYLVYRVLDNSNSTITKLAFPTEYLAVQYRNWAILKLPDVKATWIEEIEFDEFDYKCIEI